jgi:hypothetical protein
MSPQEYAKELVQLYLDASVDVAYVDNENDLNIGSGYMNIKSAIGCAIIDVDNTIKSHQLWSTEQDEYYYYYNEVKQELIKLKQQ